MNHTDQLFIPQTGSGMNDKTLNQTDVWTTRENLCLISAVSRIGDKNWISVSKTINLITIEVSRPPDWYSAKNCALQYRNLQEQLYALKKKKEKIDTIPNTGIGDMLLKQLNQKRVEELRDVMEEERTLYDQLRKEIIFLESNQCNPERLHQFWDEIVKEQEQGQEDEIKVYHIIKEPLKDETPSQLPEKSVSPCDLSSKEKELEVINSTSLSEMDVTKSETVSNEDFCPSVEMKTNEKLEDEDEEAIENELLKVNPEEINKKTVCMKEEVIDTSTTVDLELMQIKQDDQQINEDKTKTDDNQPLVATNDPHPVSEASSKSVSPAAPPAASTSNEAKEYTSKSYHKQSPSENSVIPESNLKKEKKSVKVEIDGEVLDLKDGLMIQEKNEEIIDSSSKFSVKKMEDQDVSKRTLRGHSASTVTSPINLDKKEAKNEFVYESVIEKKPNQNDGETGHAKRGRKKKVTHIKDEEKLKKYMASASDFKSRTNKDNVGDKSFELDQKEPFRINPQLLVEKLEKIDFKMKVSEVQVKVEKKEVKDEYEFDDDASRESTDVKDFLLRRKQSMNESISSPVISESTPSSPASINYCDDPESEKLHRQWKKAIMLVWNEIASHKNASIFLKPITEEKVPGYQSVVFRPMDLQTIKRNMENCLTKTSSDFQRDIMLMLLNAKMYNKDRHICRMAHEMLKDSLDIIEEFMTAQAPIKVIETPQKNLRRETRESSAKRVEERRREEREEKPTKRRKI